VSDERTPAGALRDAAELFVHRQDEYGNTWKDVGDLLVLLFPDGVVLNTPAEFSRYCSVQLCLIKLRRYCVNFADGGHLDSAKDLQVYAAMLEVKTDAV
jgi:hypothetical protein